MGAESLVAVEAPGLVAVASASWRHRGNIRATVVVKAEWAFGNGVLAQVQAEPIRRDTEMAFVLAHAEVIFAGLGHAPAVSGRGRIGVWRGAQELVGLDLAPPANGGATPGGRVSPFAPGRAAHLHGFSPAFLQQPFVELPDAFDSAFFQCAPAAQWLAGLAGGDAVVLDNLYPGHRRLALQLPTVLVEGSGHMLGRAVPIRFGLDTVFIDAERHRCTLLWRGRLAASSVDALAQATARVDLSVSDGGRVVGDIPPPWPYQTPRLEPATPAVDPESFEGTVVLGTGHGTADTHGSSPFEGTVALQPTEVRAAAVGAATPFGAPPSSAPPSAAASAIPGAPWSGAPQSALPLVSHEGVTETVGLETLAALGPSSGGPLKLPKGLRRPKSAAPAPVSEMPASTRLPEPRANEQAETARLDAERKEREAAAADERRRLEAEKFAAEQRAAEKAEAERAARELADKQQVRKQIKSFMYGKFDDKK